MQSRLLALALALVLTTTGMTPAAEPVNFNRDIRPILSNYCFACHGPDKNERQADLRLDQREGAIATLESGMAAIIPGDVTGSELIRRIQAGGDDRMPPAETQKQLTADQRDLLTRWVSQGAAYQQHWSFLPLQRPTPPSIRRQNWVQNPIDNFVLRTLQHEGLSPTPEADRETLIRRVALDLTGLPPTIAEIDSFLADPSPRAFETVVDHYLQSQAYGEHMARYWLDLARYADTNGYQYDTEREMWVWRDWVIDAYNRNQPFDQFTIDQLAGDLVTEATPNQHLATGFNRNHGITIEGGVIDEEYRTEYVMDRVVTTSTVWLGLTMGCARCHEHKFDPISQREFYQFFAFFNQVAEKGNSGFNPKFQAPSPLASAQHKQLDARLARLQDQLKRLPTELEPGLTKWIARVNSAAGSGWRVITPTSMVSSGKSTMTRLEDNSILVGEANPGMDTYEISSRTDQTGITVVRLQTLTHPSLPGGGPGRHTNSNFVLSEFELVAVSLQDPEKSEQVTFSSASADYSQNGYSITNAIDGIVTNNNGWAVDGPTRKKPCTALFVARKPFGYAGGTELRFRLRHEASFGTHGIGRPRLSTTCDDPDQVQPVEIPDPIRRLAGLEAADRTAPEMDQLRGYYLGLRQREIQGEVGRLEKSRVTAFPATMVMADMPVARETHLLIRGEYNQPGEKVIAGVPAIFPPLSADQKANRLAMARWLTDPAHPLTARVAVNRYWQRLFGNGLVKTAEDFGTQGELPSHPDLLDWLATEFIQGGWNIKAIHRLIVTSATYRQDSTVDRKIYQRDPENRLLSRAPRLRLDAEQIRDSALAASGLLVEQLGGRSVYPYQPPGLWLELNNRPGYSRSYQAGSGNDLYRRSMYTFWKRTVNSPMMGTFDAPEREFCTIRRSRTNTPLQALLLQNGPQFVEAARRLGRRMVLEGGESVEQRIIHGFRLVTARRPTPGEIRILHEVYEQRLALYRDDPSAAATLLSVGAMPRDRELDTAEHATWTVIGRLLLNLDEAITRG